MEPKTKKWKKRKKPKKKEQVCSKVSLNIPGNLWSCGWNVDITFTESAHEKATNKKETYE